MPTHLMKEGRKHNGNGHAPQGRAAASPQREDEELNAVLNEIVRLVDASKEGRLRSGEKPRCSMGRTAKSSRG
jgi:hypothetical protein